MSTYLLVCNNQICLSYYSLWDEQLLKICVAFNEVILFNHNLDPISMVFGTILSHME